MYGNDVRSTAIFGEYGTAVRTVRNCSENTNVYGVRPFTRRDAASSSTCFNGSVPFECFHVPNYYVGYLVGGD